MELIEADWPAPPGVGACVTTRRSGNSLGPYAAGNLGTHVGDEPGHVATNRRDLLCSLGGIESIQWLRQVHGTQVYRPADRHAAIVPEADAIVTGQAGLACAVLTADCLPVCLATVDGSTVAVAHAGWRGLASGVLEQTVRAMGPEPSRVLAWLGPAIGPCHFEVGEDVRSAFLSGVPEYLQADLVAAFRPAGEDGKWWADLYALARQRLRQAGVMQCFGGGFCTFCDQKRFYSYRRDGENSGRIATLVYRLP